MSKSTRKTQMNTCLRNALREYHAASGDTQEKLAEKLDISPRACSALENGKSGFSAFSAFRLFALLTLKQQIVLIIRLCEIVTHISKETAEQEEYRHEYLHL